MKKAAKLFDVELAGKAVDNATRHVRKVLKKGAQEVRRAELDGEAQAVVVATMGGANQPSVAVIQVEVPG
jgi:hypothetical protein